MPDTDGIGHIVRVRAKISFRYFLPAATPLHTLQLSAGAVCDIIVMILPFCKVIVKAIVLFYHRGRLPDVLHQDQLKVLAQGFDHRSPVHLFCNMVHGKCIAAEPEVKKLEPCLIGKQHTDAAVRHGFDDQQATQVSAHHVYLRAVNNTGKLRFKRSYAMVNRRGANALISGSAANAQPQTNEQQITHQQGLHSFAGLQTG